MSEKKYTLGLDLGTNSIGWAVLDEENNLVKKRGHYMWGVRMFEESQDAKSTRLYRNTRRHIKRRKERINLLQSIFAEQISSIDEQFFARLNESFYRLEDRNVPSNALFNNISSKDYYKKYHTIWHLRKDLLNSKEKFDIRYIYLALHHIIKYRGNFLSDAEEFKKSDYSRIIEILSGFNSIIIDTINNLIGLDMEFREDYLPTINDIDENFVRSIETILTSDKTKNDKKRGLNSLFNSEKSNIYKDFFIPLLVSGKVNISKLGIVTDISEKLEIDLDRETLDEDIKDAASKVPYLIDVINYIPYIKEIKDFYYLLVLLGGCDNISEAMVKKYDEHKRDLVELKKFVKNYLASEYSNIFRKIDVKGNYVDYIGSTIFVKGHKKVKYHKNHCAKKDFYSYIKNLLKDVTDDEAQEKKNYFLSKIENDTFLLRINGSENASLPMQLHFAELKRILNTQSKFYPFLLEECDGYTNSDKIKAIFSFKRPYYIGPLKSNSKYSWVKDGQVEDGIVYPWNFNDMVKSDEIAISFINKMQNKCTYLKGENDFCLPKESIAYSEYMVLTYINKIKINGKLIDINIKKHLYEEVFLKKEKPYKNDIRDFLKTNYGCKTSDVELLELDCSMRSLIKFKEIFKDKFDIRLAEEIIKDITIFEDKKILEKRLRKVYKINDESVIQAIKQLNYKKYGRFSRNLLTGFEIENQTTGEIYYGVLPIMRETNLNLQEILYSEDYKLNEIIDNYNKEQLPDDDKSNEERFADFLDENITIAPSFRRTFIQAYKLIEEIEEILGTKIDTYSIECNRKREKDKDSKSRYDYIKEIYSDCKNLAQELNIKSLEESLDLNKDSLKQEKIYLYFMQLGRDMYTYKEIDFNNLDAYDVDHIYPQSLIKDDSFSNKVLTLKTKNNEKRDTLLPDLKGFLNPNCYSFFKVLKERGMISQSKYERLTETEVSEAKLEGFVNRQKVVTDQSVKALITTLKLFKGVDETKIIYSKASNISDFRKMFDIYKSRTANNYHHAHDAYLNAYVGKVLDTYYRSLAFSSKKDLYRAKLDGEKFTLNPVVVLEKDRKLNKSGTNVWSIKEDVTKIKKNIFTNFDIQETVMTKTLNTMFSKTSYNPAKDAEGNIPIKSRTPNGNPFDVTKYGGIKSNSYAKYYIVYYEDKNGNPTYKLIPIPGTVVDKDDDVKMAYIKTKVGSNTQNVRIVNDNIKTNSVVEHNNKRFIVTGVSSGGAQFVIKNVFDRNFNDKCILTIRKIDKYLSSPDADSKMNTNNKLYIGIKKGKNGKRKEDVYLTLDELEELYKEILKLYKKPIYSYSNIISLSNKLKSSLYDYQNIIENKNKENCSFFFIKSIVLLLNELLTLLKTNEGESADLSIINLPKKAGTLLMSNTLSKGMKIVNYSITGLKKKVIFEVK